MEAFRVYLITRFHNSLPVTTIREKQRHSTQTPLRRSHNQLSHFRLSFYINPQLGSRVVSILASNKEYTYGQSISSPLWCLQFFAIQIAKDVFQSKFQHFYYCLTSHNTPIHRIQRNQSLCKQACSAEFPNGLNISTCIQSAIVLTVYREV